MSITVRRYTPADEQAWDTFCAGSFQGTLLHTRRFLGYHGDRFEDRSLVLEEEGRWVGVLPAATHPADARCVSSHPGATYGGVLHQGALLGDRMLEALRAVAAHYAAEGANRLAYKAVPAFYHAVPAQDDLHALFRMGAQRVRCDLSSTIDLAARRPLPERRRRSLRKAQQGGVRVSEGLEGLDALWDVIAENLQRKHGVAPVHTAAELRLLAERFPRDITIVCADKDGRVVAGVVVFRTRVADHAQYIAGSEEGYRLSALDAVFQHCIDAASAAGKRWFDFGISTEEGGTVLNEGLYRFKSEFGGGGTVHEFFDIRLGE